MPVKRPLVLNYSGESPTAFAEMDDAALTALFDSQPATLLLVMADGAPAHLPVLRGSGVPLTLASGVAVNIPLGV
jgi:hypothetical protein